MASRLAPLLATRFGRAVAGALVSGAVNEGGRQVTDWLGRDTQSPAGSSADDTSVSGAARRVVQRNRETPPAPVPATGQDLSKVASETMAMHRSPTPMSEGVMEGPYARSRFMHHMASSPLRAMQAVRRGLGYAHDATSFALSTPQERRSDLTHAATDTLAELHPVQAAGTLARTSSSVARPGKRDELYESAGETAKDLGTRTAAQLASGAATSFALKRLPVVGPAAAMAQMAMTAGGVLTSSARTGDSMGPFGRHLSHHISARRLARAENTDAPEPPIDPY